MDKENPNKRSGDYELFIKLYLANERRIYGYVRALIPNWSDVDDVIQETASVMWSKFGAFEKGSNFTAWSLKIAHFQVLNYYKTRKTNRLYFSENTIANLSDKIASKNPNVDERLSILRKCLQKLHANELSLIQMRYEPGSSTRSVSRQTGKELHVLYRLFNKIHAKLLLCIRRTLAEREAV
jgi:RNA polymerase sigma-70 factor (ECF subfamily)